MTGINEAVAEEAALDWLRDLPPGLIVERFTESVRDTLLRSCRLTEDSHALAVLRDSLLPQLVAGEQQLDA